MTKQKIYIAGKVTGEPLAECTMKFGKAQKELEAQGFEVVNPLEVVNNYKEPWLSAMRVCIKALMDCDQVFALEDWNSSNGASVEIAICQMLDIPITFENEQ